MLHRNAEERWRTYALAKAGQAEVRERCSEPRIVDQIEEYLNATVVGWPKTPERLLARLLADESATANFNGGQMATA